MIHSFHTEMIAETEGSSQPKQHSQMGPSRAHPGPIWGPTLPNWGPTGAHMECCLGMSLRYGHKPLTSTGRHGVFYVLVTWDMISEKILTLGHGNFLNSTGRHEHFLNSTERHIDFLKSTCDIRTPHLGPLHD